MNIEICSRITGIPDNKKNMINYVDLCEKMLDKTWPILGTSQEITSLINEETSH